MLQQGSPQQSNGNFSRKAQHNDWADLINQQVERENVITQYQKNMQAQQKLSLQSEYQQQMKDKMSSKQMDLLQKQQEADYTRYLADKFKQEEYQQKEARRQLQNQLAQDYKQQIQSQRDLRSQNHSNQRTGEQQMIVAQQQAIEYQDHQVIISLISYENMILLFEQLNFFQKPFFRKKTLKYIT